MVPTTSTIPLKKARRPLFRFPLSKDWTFWLFAVLAGVGGVQSMYRTGRDYAYFSPAATLVGGLIDILVSLVFGLVIFMVLPALIRKLVFLPRDRRALRTRPADPAPGWHLDPLKLTQQRWWDGTNWTVVTEPATQRRVGTGAVVVVAVLIAATGIAFAAGRSTSPFGGEPSGSSEGAATTTSNAAMMVSLSFEGLAGSVQAYNSITVDPNAPFANITQVKAAFDKVETNYKELSGALAAIKSQVELGPSAPDLVKLRALVAALGPYIQTRKDYYAALEACGPISDQRQPTDCDVRVFDAAEKPMVDSIQPVATAWDAVIASIPTASGNP